jgi:hypothetical protein
MNIRTKKILFIVWLAACTGIFIYWLVSNITSFQSVLDWLSKLDNPEFVNGIGQEAAATMRSAYKENLIKLSISLILSIVMYVSVAVLLIPKTLSLFRNKDAITNR